jgi:kynureninase
MYLVDHLLSQSPYDFSIGTPREDEHRGGHVAIEHKEGLRVGEALRFRGIIPDFRPPNILRIAPIPLYNTYYEIWQLTQHLIDIIDKKEYDKFPKERKAIS